MRPMLIPRLVDYTTFRLRADHQRIFVSGRPAAMPLVSIVTVCRNAHASIVRTIASVRNQTYPWIEHIIIDGASTDGTWELIRSQPCFPGWCLSEPDGGISDAFNRGISAAAGSFIAILNADDTFHPNAISASMETFIRDPQAAWSFSGCDFTLDGEVVLHQAGDLNYTHIINRTMPRLNHPTVIMRAAAYDQHGLFRTDLHLAMDYDLLLRFHRAGLHGALVPLTIATMSLGGISCRNIFSAYREAAAISVDHGRHPFPALLGQLRRSIIPALRLFAQATGIPARLRTHRRQRRLSKPNYTRDA